MTRAIRHLFLTVLALAVVGLVAGCGATKLAATRAVKTTPNAPTPQQSTNVSTAKQYPIIPDR